MAKKMWAGRFEKATDKEVNDYNSSLPFDCKMYSQDIEGSIAHSQMLAKQGVISQKDADDIKSGLLSIKEDVESGKLTFDSDAEDNEKEEEGYININIEINKINSKKEELERKKTIGLEKNIISKSNQKRPSQIFHFTNPLNNNEIQQPNSKTKVEKKEIQKSKKIFEKSNIIKNLMQRKSTVASKVKNEIETPENDENTNVDFFKRNSTLTLESFNIKGKKKI